MICRRYGVKHALDGQPFDTIYVSSLNIYQASNRAHGVEAVGVLSC